MAQKEGIALFEEWVKKGDIIESAFGGFEHLTLKQGSATNL